jgi:hypothetical protein
MLTYSELRENRKEFLAATGLYPEEFERLMPVFKEKYTAFSRGSQTKKGKPRQRKIGGGTTGKLDQDEDKLLFILVYQKTYPLQTMHGLQFDLSQPQVNYWIHQLLPILQESLKEMGLKPERDAVKVANSPLMAETAADLMIDGTERRRQRPKNGEEQEKHYSGKKKTHTDKNLVLVNNQSKKVLYLSPTVGGQTHDKKIADENPINYPAGATLGKDTGFQGYEPVGIKTFQPQKKPKGKELSQADKWLNSIISGARVVVENCIAGIKRCRILKDVLRNTKPGFSDLVMEVACGLHNLRVECRHPLPSVNLVQFRI